VKVTGPTTTSKLVTAMATASSAASKAEGALVVSKWYFFFLFANLFLFVTLHLVAPK
jgi:hypothetical protein